MKFVKKANKIAKKLIKKDNVQSPKKHALNAFVSKDVYLFSSQIQILITKIGLILSECSEDKKLQTGNSSDSLQYICKNVLNDPKLLSDILKTGINSAGNEAKHEIKDYKIDLDRCLKLYNQMIKELVQKTKIKSFKKLQIEKPMSLFKKMLYVIFITVAVAALIVALIFLLPLISK